jgi:hypothetical protein
MAGLRTVITEIVRRARDDKEFFHALVFDTEKALAGVEGLDETTRKKLLKISPTGLFIAPLVRTVGVEYFGKCDPTCDQSCGSTCGILSCSTTCGVFNESCARTCGISCDETLDVARFESEGLRQSEIIR